jgi:hypothetical protein
MRSPYGISSPLGIRMGHKTRHISILHHTLVHGHRLVYGDCVHRHEHRDQACTSCTQHALVARAREMQEMDPRYTCATHARNRNICIAPLVKAPNINYACKQEQGRSNEAQPPAKRATSTATSQESQRGRATRQEQQHSHHTTPSRMHKDKCSRNLLRPLHCVLGRRRRREEQLLLWQCYLRRWWCFCF